MRAPDDVLWCMLRRVRLPPIVLTLHDRHSLRRCSLEARKLHVAKDCPRQTAIKKSISEYSATQKGEIIYIYIYTCGIAEYLPRGFIKNKSDSCLSINERCVNLSSVKYGGWKLYVFCSNYAHVREELVRGNECSTFWHVAGSLQSTMN